MSILIDRNSRVMTQGITGKTGQGEAPSHTIAIDQLTCTNTVSVPAVVTRSRVVVVAFRPGKCIATDDP